MFLSRENYTRLYQVMEGITKHVIEKKLPSLDDKENNESTNEELRDKWLNFQACLKNLGVKIKSNSPVAFDFVKGLFDSL